MAVTYIGTSGFSYPHWRGEFYPLDLPQSKWFEYYCQHFDTVELNVSFYRLPKKTTFEKWRAKAGPDFVFAIKGNRYLTHVKKLKDGREAVRRFFENAKGAKLAAKNAKSIVLWQLPPRFKVNLERLSEFLGLLPRTWRHAFEFRDESWNDTRVFKLIRQFGAAIVIQDYPGWPIIQEATADFVYLRFHGRQALYSSCYTERELGEWAKKIGVWRKKGYDGYIYFNNDALGYVVENARELKRLTING